METRTSDSLSPETQKVLDLFKQTPSIRYGYSSSYWLRLLCTRSRGSYETIVLSMMRNRNPVKKPFSYEREVLVVPSDGTTYALDWVMQKPTSTKANVVVIIPPLLESSRHEHVKRLGDRLYKQGFHVVVFNPPGCGGLKLTSSVFTNAFDLKTLQTAMEYIHGMPTTSALYSVGFSMGAGVLLRYMGELGSECPLSGAVAISPGYDYLATPDHTDRAWWDEKVIVPASKRNMKKNAPQLNITEQEMEAMKTTHRQIDFDAIFTVPRLGYPSVEAFYQAASPIRVTSKITVPTCTLSAKDDPVLSAAGVPVQGSALLGKNIVALVTETGGHYSFMQGFSLTSSYQDDVVCDWLDACLRAKL
jgi:predicted alpha/beta-fold hydrolase